MISVIIYCSVRVRQTPNTGEKVPVYVDGELWGRQEGYESKYRLVKYIFANSDKVTDAGNRLEYTLDGFELFDLDGDPDTPPILDEDDAGYPTFLIPNTVYYLQMYSTKSEHAGTNEYDKMSDLSSGCKLPPHWRGSKRMYHCRQISG